MGRRGPKPSGEALTGAERQRRYRERQAIKAAKARGTLCIQIGGFERRFIEAEAEVSGSSPEKIAAQMLHDAIRAKALEMWSAEMPLRDDISTDPRLNI